MTHSMKSEFLFAKERFRILLCCVRLSTRSAARIWREIIAKTIEAWHVFSLISSWRPFKFGCWLCCSVVFSS